MDLIEKAMDAGIYQGKQADIFLIFYKDFLQYLTFHRQIFIIN